MDLRGQVSGGYEQGLLSVAFHPRFQENRTFFVYYTDRRGRCGSTATRPIPAGMSPTPSRVQVLEIPQPAANHNGGMMAFGPTATFTSARVTGKGGRSWGNAQNLSTLLGKLLRIDVDGGEPYAIPPDNPFVDHPEARPEFGRSASQPVALLL